MADLAALAKKYGGTVASKSGIDLSALAAKYGGSAESGGGPVKSNPTDTIGPDTRGPAERWFSDLKHDVQTGSNFTGPGRLLHKIGVQPTHGGGQSDAVGDLFGGMLSGPAEIGEGIAAISPKNSAKKNIQNVNQAVRGVGHTLALPAAVAAPESVVPTVGAYGPIQSGIEAGLNEVGVDPDTSELIGTAGMLAAPGAKKLAGPAGRVVEKIAPTVGGAVGYGGAAYELAKHGVSPTNLAATALGSHPAAKLATAVTRGIGKGMSAASDVPLFPHEFTNFEGESDMTPDEMASHVGMDLPKPQVPAPKLLSSGPTITPPPIEDAAPLIRTPQAQVVRGKGGRMTKQFLTGESETDDKPRMGSQAPLLPGLGDSQAPPPLNASTAAQPTTEFKNNGIIPRPNGNLSGSNNPMPPISASQTSPLISTHYLDSEVVPSNPATGQQSVTLPETKSGPQLVSSPPSPVLSDTEIRANFGGVNGPQPVDGAPRRTNGATKSSGPGDLINFPEPAPLTKESESPIINTGQDMPKSPDMSRRAFLKGAAKTVGAASMPKNLIDAIAGPEATSKVADSSGGFWKRLDLSGDDDVDYNGGGLYRLGEALKAYASANKPEGKFNVSHEDLENHFEGDDLLDEGPGGTSRYFADSLSPRIKDLLSDSGIQFTPDGISVADPSKVGRLSSIADTVSGSYDPSFIEPEAFSKAGSEIEPLIQAREKLGWSSPSAAEQWENYKNSDDYKKRFGEKPAESKIPEATNEDKVLPGDFSLNQPTDFHHNSGAKNLINTGIDPNISYTEPESHPETFKGVYLSNQPEAEGFGTSHKVRLERGSPMRPDPEFFDHDMSNSGIPDPLIYRGGKIPSGNVNTSEDLIDTKGIQQDMRENLDRGEQSAEDLRMKAAYKGSKPGYNPELPGEDGNTDLMPWAKTPWDKPTAESEPPADRRTDTSRRKLIEDMSPEEMKKELLTSDKTGLPNRRAFEEAQTKGEAATVGMSDADGLKALNDKFGYEAGDQLLKAKAEALKEAGLDSYHDKGDEFLHRGDSPEDLQNKLEKARDIFRNRVIEVQMKDGTTRQFKGADFSFGTGGNLEDAEAGLKEHKTDREAKGERARGELRGITEVEPK